MARIRPTAQVSDWMVSAAAALPRSHKQPAPYTLAEAIIELGAYADSVHPEDWSTARAVKTARGSLRLEVEAQRAVLGDCLGALIGEAITAIQAETARETVVALSGTFANKWVSDLAISAAFEDLCDAAKEPGITSERLRQLSEIVASQLGADATSHSSPLRQAADALVTSEEELARWRNEPLPSPLSEQNRVDLARETLTRSAVGHVVVWAVYSRAAVWGMRSTLGPITLLEPDWALPNAADEGVHDFPERAELRRMREQVRWFDDVHKWSVEPDSRLAMARIDLGERHVAGAAEDARRLVEAVLAIAVTAGGVSWQYTGTGAVLLDGTVRMSSRGYNRGGGDLFSDLHGIGATADILHEVEEQLGAALAARPMPDHLIEALSALREARMTDHRDVSFHGARPVTPRFATALEDHAMELIASVIGVSAKALSSALEQHHALRLADSRALGQLMAPFDEGWATEGSERRRELEDLVSRHDEQGARVVSVAKVVANQEDIRALPMTALQRADFEAGLLVCTEPMHEHKLLRAAQQDSATLRARHRRVRNAVNHGLPLASATLGSVREYAASTARTALDLALTWFIGDTSGAALIEEEKATWSERLARVARRESWAVEQADLEDAAP